MLNVIVLAAAVAGSGLGPLKDSGTAFAREALQPFVDSGELSGAVSVFSDADRQETVCVGYADVEKKRSITVDDIFRQFSQTKGFCGVTVAMLIEEGKIGLDDPVSKYLPTFGEVWVGSGTEDPAVRTLTRAKTPITVRMCMNHTSGLPFDFADREAMGGANHRMPIRSVAVMASKLPLLFEPGTEVQYSNLGIDVGAAIVEAVTGKRWEVFLKERVLDPLGMTESTFFPTDAQVERQIGIYECREKAAAVRVPFVNFLKPPYADDHTFAAPASGLWPTTRDQLKFYRMLMNLGLGDNGVRVLKEETVKNLLAVSTRPKGKTASGKDFGGYSLGLSAPVTDVEDAWFGHGGALGSNCAVNWHRRRLWMWNVQHTGGPRPWEAAHKRAMESFFRSCQDTSGVDAYTNRQK